MKTPLTPEESDRVPGLVAEAGALRPAERAAFLARTCAGADGLRAEVESLLGFAEKAPGFLAQPAADRGLELLGARQGQDLQPGQRIDDYQILSLLGVGGMGEVYLARDTVHGREVALKLIGSGRAGEARGRHFRHERRVLAALNHPHIARLYGSGETPDGQAYLVMEYVAGERLDRFCTARGLSIDERLVLFRKVCVAVAYAHQNLVVHRDLKPANIRVTPEGEPKLLDFGIAKLLDPAGTTTHADPTLTMQGAMTPEYASPEQIKGESITTASDVYSLGVVLYELLCDQRPFAHLKGHRPDELARAICEETPPRPSTVAHRPDAALTRAGSTVTRLRQQLTGDLDNIVAKALQKEPARRYPGVLAFSEDIRRYCDGLPVRARKDTLGYRAGKFVRRNRVGVAVTALFLLGLIGGLVAATWQAHIADRERDRARAALANAETARRQTQRINDFLQKLLGSANPYNLGKDVKVVQVLDAASATVDQTLANEPEVLAEVHRTLGQTYLGLSMLPAADAHFRAEFTLLQRLHGLEDSRVVNAEKDLALVKTQQGQYEEAVRLLQHVTGWLRQHSPGHEASREKSLSTLGFCLGQTHRFSEAQQALDEAIAITAKTDGENSLEYAINLGQLGALKREQGDLEAAVKLFQRERTILSKVAPDSTDVVIAGLNQCLACIEAGKFDEAGALLGPVKADCQRIVGENGNFLYTNVLFITALLEFQRGEFKQVADGGKNLLDRFVAYLPPDDLDVVTTDYLLGVSLTRTGRAQEGEPYLRAALTHFNPVKRAFFLLHGNAETALGECLQTQSRYAEAEPLLLAGFEDLQKRLGPQDHLTLQAAVRLHDLYVAWGKLPRAAAYKPEQPSTGAHP